VLTLTSERLSSYKRQFTAPSRLITLSHKGNRSEFRITLRVRPLRGASYPLLAPWRCYTEGLRLLRFAIPASLGARPGHPYPAVRSSYPAAHPASPFGPGRTIPVRPFGGEKVHRTFSLSASPSQ